MNVPIEPSTALQLKQRSAAKPLKFGQFPTTSSSKSRAKIDQGSKFAALIGKCAVIGLIKQPIRFSRRSRRRNIA